MNQVYVKPENRPVRGVFVFKAEGKKAESEALDLLKSINCRVLSSLNNRITVSSSRGNLQKIKRCWQSDKERSELGRALNQQVAQIIIGGNI